MSVIERANQFFADRFPRWQLYFLALRYIFIFFDIVLLAALIFVARKGLRFRPHVHPSHTRRKRIFTLADELLRRRWNAIVEGVKRGTPEAWKNAVIDADKLVDDALQGLGLPGAHTADRLSQIRPGELASLDRVLRAHRLRNNLVHTPGFAVTPDEAKKALLDFQAFLKEVNVIARK